MSQSTKDRIESLCSKSFEGHMHLKAWTTGLAKAGVDSYQVDLRAGSVNCYASDGTVHCVKVPLEAAGLAQDFNRGALKRAVSDALHGDLKSLEFLRRALAAGCVGYIVWIAERRATYFGSRGEVVSERIPVAPQKKAKSTKNSEKQSTHFSERFARVVTTASGSTPAFLAAIAVVAIWGLTGPLFGYSDTWQLVINTGTTVVTFLMVFLIQRAQNKDSRAVHLKLNELVAALQGASNRLVNVEDIGEDELEALHEHYRTLANMAKKTASILESHSIEEAEQRHLRKQEP
jgi:low affinity Fe/Cu permease/uncharacterized protein YbcV (DUF1398 family)